MKPTILLLAAGRSSRMEPLSNKIFAKYLGKELIVHQFEHILGAGFEKFIIVGNEININKLKSLIKPNKKVMVDFVVQPDLNEGIKGAVLSAQKKINSKEPIIIISSNDYVEKTAYKKLLEEAKKTNNEIIIIGKTVDKYFPGGYLELNSKKQIKKIVEKPKPGQEPSNLVALMVQYFKNPQNLMETYQKVTNQHDDAHEQAMQILFDQKINSSVVEYQGCWQAIKYPFHQLVLTTRALDLIKKTFIHPKAEVSKKASINGNCYIEEGVKIFDFAVIQGPCYIGKNTIIGNHSLVRNSHIGENCVIGSGCDICRSYFSSHVWTHQNFIGDSIIESNVSFGAGARTANLRLDEENIEMTIKGNRINSNSNKLGAFIGKNSRIGINTSIMPGIKIGRNSFITSGIVVDKNIPEKSFIKKENKLLIKSNFKKLKHRNSFEQ